MTKNVFVFVRFAWFGLGWSALVQKSCVLASFPGPCEKSDFSNGPGNEAKYVCINTST